MIESGERTSPRLPPTRIFFNEFYSQAIIFSEGFGDGAAFLAVADIWLTPTFGCRRPLAVAEFGGRRM
ncbi:MAG: hypothetical protein MPL62_10935 [Alphaproteobacteria bacterium]|nr:hypothetical protein [Alphaproteobacteria bacterium]